MRIYPYKQIQPDTLNEAGFKYVGGYFIKIDGVPLLNGSKNNITDEIIEAYSQNIETIYHKLDNSYAVIIYNNIQNSLTIITDPYGIEKIYYYYSPDWGLSISSSIEKLLSECPQKEINPDGLAEYLRFLDISPPFTIFKDIYCLESGCILTYAIDTNELQIKRNSLINKRNDNLPHEDYLQAFEMLLSESIEKRTGSANKIGIMLSGGIDSSLLAAVMSLKKRSQDVYAYTVGFDDMLFDESRVAQKIAGDLNIKHLIMKFSLSEEIATFHQFVNSSGMPHADPAVIPTMLAVKRITEDGIDTIVEGTGADGAIGSMPSRSHRLIFNYTSHIHYQLRRLVLFILKTIKDPMDIALLFDYTEAQEKFIRWKGWTKIEIEKLCGIQCSFEQTAFYKTYNEYKKNGIYELYRKLLISMPDYRITETLKHFKVKIAFPFFDRQLREYLEAIPMSLKYQNGTGKVLYKELLSKYIPKEIWDVPKHGFDYPFDKLLKYNRHDLPKAFLSKDALKHGLFDTLIVDRYLQSFLNGDDTVKFKIWALVVFQAWYLKHSKVSSTNINPL